jgi:hypothetical protein
MLFDLLEILLHVLWPQTAATRYDGRNALHNVRRILSPLGYDDSSIAMRMRIAKAGRNDEPSAVDTFCRFRRGNRPDSHNSIATQCDVSDKGWGTTAVDNGSAFQKRIDFHSAFRSQDASDCLGNCSQCAGRREGF